MSRQKPPSFSLAEISNHPKAYLEHLCSIAETKLGHSVAMTDLEDILKDVLPSKTSINASTVEHRSIHSTFSSVQVNKSTKDAYYERSLATAAGQFKIRSSRPCLADEDDTKPDWMFIDYVSRLNLAIQQGHIILRYPVYRTIEHPSSTIHRPKFYSIVQIEDEYSTEWKSSPKPSKKEAKQDVTKKVLMAHGLI